MHNIGYKKAGFSRILRLVIRIKISDMLKVTRPHSATSHSLIPLGGNPFGLPTQRSGRVKNIDWTNNKT